MNTPAILLHRIKALWPTLTREQQLEVQRRVEQLAIETSTARRNLTPEQRQERVRSEGGV